VPEDTAEVADLKGGAVMTRKILEVLGRSVRVKRYNPKRGRVPSKRRYVQKSFDMPRFSFRDYRKNGEVYSEWLSGKQFTTAECLGKLSRREAELIELVVWSHHSDKLPGGSHAA
jgi:hypothetical protein